MFDFGLANILTFVGHFLENKHGDLYFLIFHCIPWSFLYKIVCLFFVLAQLLRYLLFFVFALSCNSPFGRALDSRGRRHKRPCVSPCVAGVPAGASVSIREATVRSSRSGQRRACGYSSTSVEKQSSLLGILS